MGSRGGAGGQRSLFFKIVKKLSVALKGDSLMIVQISLKHGQENVKIIQNKIEKNFNLKQPIWQFALMVHDHLKLNKRYYIRKLFEQWKIYNITTQADIPISGMPKIAQNLSVALKGDSLMKVKISLKHGQESASFKSADFAQGSFSAKNINQTKAVEKNKQLKKPLIIYSIWN